LRRYLQ